MEDSLQALLEDNIEVVEDIVEEDYGLEEELGIYWGLVGLEGRDKGYFEGRKGWVEVGNWDPWGGGDLDEFLWGKYRGI